LDLLTGGASAVYGSDAIAGVVNFVLDDAFHTGGALNYNPLDSAGAVGRFFTVGARHAFK
ncbi:hypothetical protein, partial [Xylella fastidiosa]|uniref:hypothetical protein n=1 Tax=Xylella fastidiosa TaxID=2371 RepID=UPI0012AE372D